MKIYELLTTKYRLDLTKQGDLYICFCPFHKDENRPNLTVYTKTDSYFCYTCNFGGDAIDFFRRMENISRQEATRRIFDDLQILIDKINDEPDPKPYNNVVDLQISSQYRNFLHRFPGKLEEALLIMRMSDMQLSRDLYREEALKLVDYVNKQLNGVV